MSLHTSTLIAEAMTKFHRKDHRRRTSLHRTKQESVSTSVEQNIFIALGLLICKFTATLPILRTSLLSPRQFAMAFVTELRTRCSCVPATLKNKSRLKVFHFRSSLNAVRSTGASQKSFRVIASSASIDQTATALYAKEMERVSAKESLLLAVRSLFSILFCTWRH